MINDGTVDELRERLARGPWRQSRREAGREPGAYARWSPSCWCAIVGVLRCRPTSRIVRDVTRFRSSTPTRAIRAQQAARKRSGPAALVAAVIFAESKFDARTSPTGALGLIQIEPSTAEFSREALGRARLVLARRPLGPGDQHRLRQLLPALPARPLRRQRDARARGVQRGRDERRRLACTGPCRRGALHDERDPVQRETRAATCSGSSTRSCSCTAASTGCRSRCATSGAVAIQGPPRPAASAEDRSTGAQLGLVRQAGSTLRPQWSCAFINARSVALIAAGIAGVLAGVLLIGAAHASTGVKIWFLAISRPLADHRSGVFRAGSPGSWSDARAPHAGAPISLRACSTTIPATLGRGPAYGGACQAVLTIG